MPKLSASSYRDALRWTPAQAHAALDAQARSGLSLREFARREGLDVQRLDRWRRRLKAATGQTRPTFVEVSPRPAAVVEVVLLCGRVLRVGESIEAAVLRRLVEVLDDVAPC